MGLPLQRIAAVKAAHPNHRSAHPLRVRLNDQEALALVGEIVANPTAFVLRDVGLKADGTPKPSLAVVAEQLATDLALPALAPDATHAEQVTRLTDRTQIHNALWE